jgi:hypothetical protein
MHPADTVTDAEPSRKDRGAAISVPCGAGLERVLDDGEQAHRRVLYSADGIVLPLLGWTAEASCDPPELPTPSLLAVRTGVDLAWRLAIEKESSRRALRALAAAAFRDIADLGEEDVAGRLGFGSPEAARRAARRGRRLWAVMGAWPWWGSHYWFGCRAGEVLPPDWRRRDGAWKSLAIWRYGLTQTSLKQELERGWSPW